MERNCIVFGAAAVLGIVGLAASANATIAFDSSLASPNNKAADPTQNSTSNSSWYNGNGNPQGGFTVAMDSTTGIELGLRAKNPAGGQIDSPTNMYTVKTGSTWNFDFSIDLQPGGFNPLAMTFATAGPASLTITDVNTSATETFDPTNPALGDAAYGDHANGNTNVVKTAILPGDWGAQNSEKLSFGFLSAGIGYSVWNGDTYRFDLSIAGVSDTIFVTAVPEPASMTLLGAGLVGLGALRRRRRV